MTRLPAKRQTQEAREISDPQPGFWLIRLGRHTPWVAARIWYERDAAHAGLPFDPWANSETRILGIFAEIAGQAAAVEDVWFRKGRAIDEREFRFLAADAEWLRNHAPTDPLANPDRPVLLTEVPIPF